MMTCSARHGGQCRQSGPAHSVTSTQRHGVIAMPPTDQRCLPPPRAPPPTPGKWPPRPSERSKYWRHATRGDIKVSATPLMFADRSRAVKSKVFPRRLRTLDFYEPPQTTAGAAVAAEERLVMGTVPESKYRGITTDGITISY